MYLQKALKLVFSYFHVKITFDAFWTIRFMAILNENLILK